MQRRRANRRHNARRHIAKAIVTTPGIRAVAVCHVHAAGASLTCHWCWAPGIRETQADFYCPECNLRCNADLNAALNIRRRAYPQLGADRRQGMSS